MSEQNCLIDNEPVNRVNDNDNVNQEKMLNEQEKSTQEIIQDEELIKEYINELVERFKEKREKRYLHNPANIEYPSEDLFVRLDTSVKKNTAFVKKIRNMTESNKEIIMKDLENLNLSRYISELATALVETKIKLNETSLFVQICSFLHLRYPEFSAQLLECWIKSFPRKSSDTFNASKMRIDIKIFTELILCGIFSTKDSLPALGNLLTILTSYDKENHKNINIIITFCRSYCVEFAGLFSRKMKLLAEKYNLDFPICDFLSADKQKGVKNLLKEYHQSLKTHISKDRKCLFHMKNDMKRNLETRGEVSDSLQEKWKMKNIEFEKLFTAATLFADLIDEDMPDIDTASLENDTVLMKNENITAVVFDLNTFKENNSTLWDDEETRTFYEHLPDLKSLIPAMLYKDSLKDGQVKENGDATPDELIDSDTKDDSILNIKDGDNSISLMNENDELENEQKEEKKNKAVKINFTTISKDQLDVFFSSLPNCVNRDLIDKAALHFSTNFNTKNNRKKLVSTLIAVSRTRLDLLPFYSRLVAQLAPIMPTVATDLCIGLKSIFRYNFKKNDQVNIESKVKVVRFIGELVKFNVFPKQEVFKIFKTLLTDFHHHNIEMTCNLFETCGQYLYRCPDTHHKTNLFLQQMMRLKTHKYVNTRYETMIQNSFYLVTPEDKMSSKNVPNKPVIHQYIEYLIYTELSKSTISNVLRKLRKLDWNNKTTSNFVIATLSSAWNIKFYNIAVLAQLLSSIFHAHSKIVLMVLDTILEDIRLGMQMNSIEYNQRRISSIKYLAECFNFNLVDSTLLFSVMYSLITYGINYSDINQSSLDSPFNLMRLRLVAQILNTCGSFLISSPAKKKLEYYLYFFQRYYWLKKSFINSLPVDQVDQNALFYIDSIFKDVIHSLKIKFRVANSYESACEQLDNKLKELANSAKEIIPNASISIRNLDGKLDSSILNIDSLEPIKEDSEEEQDEKINEMVDNESQDSECSDIDDYTDEEEQNTDNGDSPRENLDSDTDSESIEYKAPDRIECEEDKQFQQDLDRLLNENLFSRSQEVVRSNVEIAIPIARDSDKKKLDFTFDSANKNENESNANESFNFRIMTKKSNKPILKSIEVPADSELVRNFLAREQKNREEKEHVKKLILNINERRELEDNAHLNENQNSFRTFNSQPRYNNFFRKRT